MKISNRQMYKTRNILFFFFFSSLNVLNIRNDIKYLKIMLVFSVARLQTMCIVVFQKNHIISVEEKKYTNVQGRT